MLHRVSAACVRIVERFMPDPFLFALVLTFLCAALALSFTDTGLLALLGQWYDGLWEILNFACQMILILVTGCTLANAPVVRRGLAAVAGLARTPRAAVVLLILVGMAASWLNWGFGLVVSALLARQMARQVRVDFPLLVAAAYSGFVVWASGLSSSIALVTATPGSKLNFIEQLTGHTIGLGHTIFTPFNLVPTLLMFVLVPLAFARMEPPPADARYFEADVPEEAAARPPASAPTPARRLEDAWLLTALLVAMGVAVVAAHVRAGSFALDIDTIIFVFLMLGLTLHGTPIRYARAFVDSGRLSGPLLLQYPLYGGIMGMMTGSGLATVMSKWFLAFATAHTLPFWSYVCSCLITLFVPSGGGHWAVQAPIMVPAAVSLGASQAGVAMGVAFGEQVANMIQPFWALPILAIAGLGIRDIMGYCVITLVLSFAVYGAALLLLV